MSASSSASFNFRCTAVAERIAGVGRNRWYVTFAPLVTPDGMENLCGNHAPFTIETGDPREAASFHVGEVYEFDIHTAPEQSILKP